MKMYAPKTAIEATQQAIDWQAWQADHSIFTSEIIKWQDHFIVMAKKFNLIEEFRENGII